MAAPSTPVIQGVSPVYPFGSNVHATWVTDTSVTSGATTLYSGSTVVSTQAASLFDTTATTKTWKVSYPIAATGTYAIGVTATNGDGTSDEATAQFVVADYSGIVLSPSGTVTGLPINVAWSIDDPNGVATQNIVIEKSDHSRVLYSSVLQPTQRTLALGSAELAGIEDGAIYVILLHVTNGVGLVTTATSTITTSWAAPVTPTVTVTTDLDTLAASVTVTGDRTYDFTDVESFTAPESGVITSLTVDGKSVQDGTPTPSAPVAIQSVESYNLLDVSGITGNTTVNHITWTANGDGTFDADGTASANSTIGLGNFTFESGVSYRVSGCPSGGGSTAYEIMVQLTTSSSSGAWKHEYGNGVTFTGDGAAHRVQLVVRNGAHVDHILFKPMVKIGNASAAFVPFECIGLSSSDGSTAYIDLQGYALRSVPDGAHDELTVDSAGVKTLTQRVESVDMGTLTWQYNSNGYFYAAVAGKAYGNYNIMCTDYAVTSSDSASGMSNGEIKGHLTSASVFAKNAAYSDAASFTAAVNGILLWYGLAAPQEIDLGIITPPFVAEGATVTIDAAVTPAFDATMRAAQSAGTPPTDTLMVVRVNPDGTRHVLAGDLESGDTVTDPLPPLGVEYAYEVTGIAATGVPSAPATVTHTNVTTCWAMNFGTGAAEVVLARFNPKASYSVEQGGELYHFADGGEGDGLPVWYGTTDRDINGSDTWDTLTHATADRLDALMRRYPVGWLRDPFGHRWRARMKPKFSHGIGKLWQVSIDWDAVRWVEA